MNVFNHQAAQAVVHARMSATHSNAATILNTPAVPADLADLQLLDKKQVSALVGLKSTAINDRVRLGDFPEPIRMGQRCTRWTAGSIKQWLQAQVEAAHEDVKQRQQVHAKKASSAAQAKRQQAIKEGV